MGMSIKPMARLLAATFVLSVATERAKADGAAVTTNEGQVAEGLLAATCLACHDEGTAEGGLDLSSLEWSFEDRAIREHWITIHDRIASEEMPPDRSDLIPNDRTTLLAALADAIRHGEAHQARHSGAGSIRRLTRTEYEDNLRDLLKLPHLDIVDRLPEDRDAHGFTKVAALLDMSHVQLAAYLDAADAALAEAVATGLTAPKVHHRRFTGTDLFPATNTFGEREAMFFVRDGKLLPITGKDLASMSAEERRDPRITLALFRSATWPYFGYPRGFVAPEDGRFRVTFSARAVLQRPGFRLVPADDPLPMSFRARQPSGADVSGDVRETGGWIDLLPKGKVHETTIDLKEGETFEYSLLGLPVPFVRTDGGFFYDFPPMPPHGHRGALIEWLEVAGPLPPTTWPPESHRVLFGDLPLRAMAKGHSVGVDIQSDRPREDAERLFRRFAEAAARRPLDEKVLAPFLELIFAKLDEGAPFPEAMLKGYQAFLCSGHFLYLTAPTGDREDDHALASRLSHLLWNSRPDDELLRLASESRLSNPDTLRSQVDRLRLDPRVERFVENFTDQWLDLKELRRDGPDIRLYPEYRKDDYLVASMERETRAFFAAMVRDNLPITSLVDGDFTFVNDRLAEHYGLPRQQGSAMRRIELPESSPYGGLLTQASILKLTSNGTSTSPVVRGVWVMEKLLGQPVPPPPESVPAIEPDIRGATTIRDLLAKHTESESCAVCHARFDPIGFALESFDIMGAWRDRYRGLGRGDKITGIDRAGHPFEYRIGPEVDASGTLMTGESFRDVRELKRLLAGRPRQLARNVLGHLTLYATGTPPRFSDRTAMEQVLDRCEPGGYGVTDLLREFVASSLFTGQAALRETAARPPSTTNGK
ncbi:hypothetical protein Pan216_11080 [Planctomycetes bacterium Pan216]|uniref:Planctomycete cytochrome C n=1 Tax=Kolteria novifilia TaxID=2527975 RepID=A0A518AZV7_9BACT|nr:hypothetical protein Pan216_11080 [Planctomycetes bacterium Pan216]